MEFFNKKEDVLEIKLTPFGKHKLSQGRFKPVYYAFFDEGILYDSSKAQIPANQTIKEAQQNAIEPRIQEGTPSLRTLNVFTGRETVAQRDASVLRAAFRGLGELSTPMQGTGLQAYYESLTSTYNDLQLLHQEEISQGLPDGTYTGIDNFGQMDLNQFINHHSTGQFDAGGAYGEDQLLLSEDLVNLATPTPAQLAAIDTYRNSLSPAYVERSPYFWQSLQPHAEKHEFMSRPLGSSRLGSKFVPAWNVQTYQGEITDSEPFIETSAGFENIPQINCSVTYNLYTGEIENFQGLGATPDIDQDFYLTDPTDVHNLQSITTDIFPNGMYIKVDKRDIIIEVVEENADFLKENYDIEVFLSASSPAIETRQLFFDQKSVPGSSPTTEDVNFYLSVTVDKEISDQILDKVGIRDLTALGSSGGSAVVSTREYFVRDLYKPQILTPIDEASEEPCE